ncbi:MAG: WD40 repeat domain-containing protein, partial [Acidobacteriota bacterium]
ALAIAGGTVVTGTSEGEVTWWREPAVRRDTRAVVKAIAASGDRVAVALSTGPIALYTLDGEPRGEVAGDPGGTEAVAFSSEGTLLASGGQDRAVHVWRAAGDRWQPAAALDGPHGDTAYVAFAPGGDLLVSAGNDGAVLAWRVAGGSVDAGSRRVIAQHTGAVSALALARGWIASAGRDAMVVRVPTGAARLPEVTRLAAAATRLAIDDDGTVHAITRTGAAVCWPRGGAATVDIDHGLRDAARLPDRASWLEALDDGTLVISSLSSRSFSELRGALARATTFRLP